MEMNIILASLMISLFLLAMTIVAYLWLFYASKKLDAKTTQ